MAALPLMAVAILVFTQADFSSARAPAAPLSGVLVVADLRGERLKLYDFSPGGTEKILALPGPPHEMVASGGRVVVTLGRAGAVAEVDPQAPGILRVLYLDGEPHGLSLHNGALLVTLDKADALVTVSTVSFTEVGRIGTGPVPHAVAADPGAVYVAEAGGAGLREVERGVVATTGAQPESVAVSGGYVVTANARGRSLSVFRQGDLALVGDVALDGIPVRLVALPGGGVAVSLSDTGAVAIVDPAALKVTKVVPVAARPDGLCVSPGGQYVAVASNAEGRVDIFQLPAWRPVAALAAGDGPGSCLWLDERRPD